MTRSTEADELCRLELNISFRPLIIAAAAGAVVNLLTIAGVALALYNALRG